MQTLLYWAAIIANSTKDEYMLRNSIDSQARQVA